MNDKIKSIITEIWQRYWAVMTPFDIDLGDGYTGHVMPFYGPPEALGQKIIEDDIEFIYSDINYHITVTHEKKAPFSYFHKAHCDILKSTDEGDLYFDKHAKEALIQIIKDYFNNRALHVDFRWHLFPVAWSAAGRDDRYKSAEIISSRNPYQSLNDGFFIFLNYIMWGNNADYHLDTFEEAVQLEDNLQDKHRSELKTVFDCHTKDMEVHDVAKLKYTISNHIVFKWLAIESQERGQFFEELEFMKDLFCNLYDYYKNYMIGMNLDWVLLFSLTHSSVLIKQDFIYKYEQLINGTKHELTDNTGNTRIIEPRKEFAKTYPLLVTLKSPEALDELFYHYIDDLKPLPTLNMAIKSRQQYKYYNLTPAKQKYIQGKFFIDDKSCNTHDILCSYVYALSTSDFDKLPELTSTPYENISENDKMFYVYSCIDHLFNVYIERTVVNRITRKHLSAEAAYNEQNVLKTLSVNFPKIKHVVQMHENGRDSLKDLKIMLLRNYNVFNNLIKKYGSYGNIVRRIRQITNTPYDNLNDSIDVFKNKVIVPALFYFSGFKSNKNNIYEKIELIVETIKYGALFYNRFPFIEMMELDYHVHNHSERFLEAGNNPESLMESMRDYNGITPKDTPEHILSTLMQEHNALINNDDIRHQFHMGRAAWLSLFDSTLKTNLGNLIVPVLNSHDIKDEGVSMSNCVGWGGYADKSRRGNCNICSIRAPNGEHLATLEIGIETKENQIEIDVRQLLGYKNSPLPSDIRNDVICTLNEFKTAFAQNYIKQKAFKHYIRTAKKLNIERTPMEKAGYGFHDYASLKAAFEPWKKHLPKDIQSPEDLFKVLYFKETVEKLNKNANSSP